MRLKSAEPKQTDKLHNGLQLTALESVCLRKRRWRQRQHV